MNGSIKRIAATVLTVVVAVAEAGAGGTPEQKCQAAKNRAVQKYTACRQKAETAFVMDNDMMAYGMAYTKCEYRFERAWQKAVAAAAAANATCSDTPLLADDFKAAIDAFSDSITTALGGGGLNNGLEAANIKNGVTILGVTGSLLHGLPKTGQTQCVMTDTGPMGDCSGAPAGQDGALQMGAPRSYSVEALTITDNVTKLEWEKLCDADPPGTACPADHDVDSTYTWAEAFAKVAAMNEASYAGHNDWRLPNNFEIESLRDMGRTNPAVAAEFDANCIAPCSAAECSCTRPDYYWSSTSRPNFPGAAWLVNFDFGYVDFSQKSSAFSVRAVRGGV